MLTKKQIDKLTVDWPQPNKIKPIQCGFNFKYSGVTYTFYYSLKHPNYVTLVVKDNSHFFLRGNELADLQKLYPATIPKEGQEPVKHKVIELPNDKGAQACINHLMKKVELVKASKRTDNARILNMLNMLIDELKQYL